MAGLLRAYGGQVRTIEIENVAEAQSLELERLAVAGGDGSIGVAAEIAASRDVPLAVIPAGTANDFARAVGLPRGVEEACRLAARGDRKRTLELGRMNGRPFVNVASAGLPPVAAREAQGMKRSLGSLAYAVGAVRAALTSEPTRCAIRCDDKPFFAGPAWQVTVACSGAFGAGASVAGDPADGLLDVVVVEAGRRVALLRRAYGLRTGSIRRQRGVRDRRCESVHIDVPAGTQFNLDGELCESPGTAEFEVERGAFEVVVG